MIVMGLGSVCCKMGHKLNLQLGPEELHMIVMGLGSVCCKMGHRLYSQQGQKEHHMN